MIVKHFVLRRCFIHVVCENKMNKNRACWTERYLGLMLYSVWSLLELSDLSDDV